MAKVIQRTSTQSARAARPAPETAREEPRTPAPTRVVPASREPAPARVPQTAPVPQRAGSGTVISQDFGSMPEFMKGDAGKGRERMEQQDLDVPRLKLIQGTSRELQEYNELLAGHFYHTALEFIFEVPFLAV